MHTGRIEVKLHSTSHPGQLTPATSLKPFMPNKNLPHLFTRYDSSWPLALSIITKHLEGTKISQDIYDIQKNARVGGHATRVVTQCFELLQHCLATHPTAHGHYFEGDPSHQVAIIKKHLYYNHSTQFTATITFRLRTEHHSVFWHKTKTDGSHIRCMYFKIQQRMFC
jgi:hypothetical protein